MAEGESAEAANALRPGYGWAVAAFGSAVLSGILAWLTIVLAHRIRRTSTDIVWQAILAGAIAVAAVAILLAVGAWRRRGGVVLARVAAVIAAVVVVVAPVGAAIARPSVSYVRISSFGAGDGAPRWTVSPHLVDAYAIMAGAPGTITVDGDTPAGLCDGNPVEATLATTNGRTVSQVAGDGAAGPVLGGPGAVAVLGVPGGGLGAESARRGTDAKVEVGVAFQDAGNGLGTELLQAIDINTGAVRWQVPVQSSTVGPAPVVPLWVDSHVVIAASSPSGGLGPFSGGISGQSIPTTTAPTGRPPLVLGPGSAVVALDAATGAERWRAYFGSGQPIAVAAGPGGVAVARSTSLSLRDLDSGTVTATATLPANILMAFSPDTGISTTSIAVVDNSVVALTGSSTLIGYGRSLTQSWARHFKIHYDPAALQLTSVDSQVYVIDQLADSTAGC